MRFDYCQTCFVLLYEVLSKNRENYDIYPKELKIHIRVYFFKQIIFHIFQSPPYTIKLNKVEHRHKNISTGHCIVYSKQNSCSQTTNSSSLKSVYFCANNFVETHTQNEYNLILHFTNYATALLLPPTRNELHQFPANLKITLWNSSTLTGTLT